MNRHGCIVTFLLFLLLSIIILSQILSMTGANRLSEHLKSSFRNEEKCGLCFVKFCR